MAQLNLWQLIVLAIPPLILVLGFIGLAGWQLHTWGLSWLWGGIILLGLVWRSLLARWLQPKTLEADENSPLWGNQQADTTTEVTSEQVDIILEAMLQKSRQDAPIWEDWSTFWQRCQELVVAIAHLYHPEVKYPLLNIYVPQAYGLIRGTADDVDRWMQQLSPVLGQVTVGQAYEAYERYQQWSPWIQKAAQVAAWARWFVNPFAAVTSVATRKYTLEANQKLLASFGQLLREAALKNLCQRAIGLYSRTEAPALEFQSAALNTNKQTVQAILAQAKPPELIQQQPVNILIVGRTGAGKSSLINSLFMEEQAAVDVLPSTDQIQSYHWSLVLDGQAIDALTLWDTPGYEQVNQPQIYDQVLGFGTTADLVLLVTPALDPALQMDVAFLNDLKQRIPDLPVIVVVSQVDRLRPLREWQPPYDWETGDRPKEINIREAVRYRAEAMEAFNPTLLPLVTSDLTTGRSEWGIEELSLLLIDAVNPAKQLKLARFLKNQEARSFAAAKIIDRYAAQMATTQGLTALLKGPTLQFISTLYTGNPEWGLILADQISVEQLPAVIAKLQMAFDLWVLLKSNNQKLSQLKAATDLIAIWPLLLDNQASPAQNATAIGYALVEYWLKDLTIAQLKERFQTYLNAPE